MEFLKFGSIIRIHSSCADQGLLVAKSFTDSSVYYMTYTNIQQLLNYRESLFQVLPRGSFEIHDEYHKSSESSKEVLELRLRTEADQYKLVIQNKMKEEVLFGAEIVLKHVDSEYYLVGSYNCSEFCTDAFKLELSPYLSSQAIFKIQPYHSYQQEGHAVYLHEPIIIEHEKSKCRIDYVKGRKIFLDENYSSDVQYKLRPKIKLCSNRYESVITHNSEVNWVIQLHEDYENSLDKSTIKSYDLCVFRSSENNAYICANDQKIILKKLKQGDAFDFPLDAVWELQQVQKSQKSFSITPFTTTGGYRSYILRHCLSGRVLTTYSGLSMDTQNAHLQISNVVRGKEELTHNCFVKISMNSIELQTIAKIADESIADDQEVFYKCLDVPDLEYIDYDVAFRSESMHAFQITKIGNDVKSDLLYIISSQELLMQFADVLKLPPDVVEQQINPKILQKVAEVLQKLVNYMGCLDAMPIRKKQTYMKELRMVEIMMEIIYFMSYRNGLEKLFMQWKSDRERTKHIFKLSYRLIQLIVRGNPSTKLHVSQWMELFLHSAMMVDDPTVQNTLSELLDNNYQAISKFINKTSIKRLVDIMRLQVPHQKYLRILSSICICNGKSIISNQINTLNLYFHSIQKEFKFTINNEVLINSFINKQNQQWRTLQQLHDESERIDELQTWDYFLSYFNLLGDVCANRNKFGKKFVEEHFGLDVLCSIVEDPLAQQLNVIEPVLKVIHGAYIDCQHYTPIRRLARVREWETIEKKNDILRTHAEDKLKPEKCDLKRVLHFVEQFIMKVDSFEHKDQNQILYSILQVLRTTLRLGFWLSITNLIDMLPHLFRLLYQEDRKFIEQEIKCKSLICEILDIIIDMETNVRVSKTTQCLKKMMYTHKERQVSIESPIVVEGSGKKRLPNDLSYMKERKRQQSVFLPIIKSPQIQQESPELNIFKGMANVLKKEIIEKDQIYGVQEWMKWDQQLIETRNIFIKVAQEPTIEQVLQKLASYQDPLLLQYSLSLLNRIHGQRRELRYNFEKVIIVATGGTWTLSVESRVTRTKLLAVVDRNILQCTLDNQKDYNIYLWRESENEKERGIIQDLCYLVETMKTTCTKKQCIYDNLFPDNQLDVIYTELEQPHKLHQSLLKSQDLHESILSFIEISNNNLQNPLLMKFLHACYRFLTMLIWNHLENKLDLMKSRYVMYNQLQYNIGCIDFMKELFQNNKTLLYSEKDVHTVARHVIQYANQTPITQYYKSKLLDFLKVLLHYNNKIIKFNQILVMAILQEKQNDNLMFILNSGLSVQNNLYNFEMLIHQLQEFNVNPSCISPQLTYMMTFFSLFMLLVDDGNDINAGKCKQMHSYTNLLGILKECTTFWPLKRYIRGYINRLYYQSNDFENISQFIIEHDFNNLIVDLDSFLELQDNHELIYINNPVRYVLMNSYIYLCVEETLITINIILSNDKFICDLEDMLHQNYRKHIYIVHLQLFEIASKVTLIKKLYSQSRHIEVLSRILINILKSIFQTFDLSLLMLREGLLNSAMQVKCITERVVITRRRMSGDDEPIQLYECTSNPTQLEAAQIKENFLDNIFQAEDHKPISRNFQSIKRMFIKVDEDINEVLNQKHRRLVNLLNNSQRFNTFMEEEFLNACLKFRSIPQQQFSEFLRNAIQMNIRSSIRPELKGFLLKILTRTITEKNAQSSKLNPDEWTPEYWSHCKPEVEAAQDYLQACGAADLICSLLSEPTMETRMQLTDELLTFTIAFLLGGNPRCQNAILIKMKCDKGNVMINNFSTLIKKIGRAIYNNYKIRKMRPQTISIPMIDNYDQYDCESRTMRRLNTIEQDEAKENAFKRQAIQLLCKSFRVLQLLCENNNVQMKNFMRIQTDEQGVKLNSINFIELTTIQLRMFLKILSKPIIVIPQFMIDFLIEIIQLPCLDNQIMLCKTTFYEDACYMNRFFQSRDNQVSRKFEKPDELWDLQELYNKIFISVISVLEGNDEKIYDDLQNKLEPKFLIDFMEQNLQILHVDTAMEMQQLLELQEQMYSSEILRILNVIIIKMNIQQKVKQSTWVDEFNQLSERLKDVVLMLESKVKNIEIIYGDKPQKIFYPSHPLFEYLSDQTKDKLMFTINRDTQREKILGLIEAEQQILSEIEYNYSLNQAIIPITYHSISTLRTVASSLSVLINGLMILFYTIEVNHREAKFNAEQHEMYITICYVTFYIVSRIPLVLRSMPDQSQQNKVHRCIASISYVILNEDALISLLMFLSVSVAGQFKHYYFSLHMFDLFSRLSLLKNVFQAISYNAKQLFVVAMLGVLFVYVFSITGFNQYVDEIYPMEEPEDSCNTLISCMITLITSGVIGTSMSKWDPIKFFLDTLHFVFFALLFTNIVSGIMIDTFAELRDKRQKIEDDKKNLCFICGVDRQTLEKNLEDFEQHIHNNHYLWNYIFYMYILIKKDSTEYTGLEYWISDKLSNEDISWFPMVNPDRNAILIQFEALQQQVSAMQKQFDKRTEDMFTLLESNIIKL